MAIRNRVSGAAPAVTAALALAAAGWIAREAGWGVLLVGVALALGALAVFAFGVIAQSELARVAPFQQDVPSARPEARRRRVMWAGRGALALVALGTPVALARRHGPGVAAAAVVLVAACLATLYLLGKSTGSHHAPPEGRAPRPREEKPWI